tara:strand:+ start:85 stop:396 length:312 start_codon:yes stop_codon:yes gene_type:complete
MNYWDLLPDDIRFKIVFDNLWDNSKDKFYLDLKNSREELSIFLNNTFPRQYQKWKKDKYYNLFIKKGINSIDKLKIYSKNDLSDIGVKWGPVIVITHNLSIRT